MSQWACDFCTVVNESRATICHTCNAPKPNRVYSQQPYPAMTASHVVNQSWQCYVCHTRNPLQARVCTVCTALPYNAMQARRPVARTQARREPTPLQRRQQLRKPSALPVVNPVMQHTHIDSADPRARAVVWSCTTCTYENQAGRSHCEMCNSAYQNSSKKSSAVAASLPSWSCNMCTFEHTDFSLRVCSMCGVARPNSEETEKKNQIETIYSRIENCVMVTPFCWYIGTLTVGSATLSYKGETYDSPSNILCSVNDKEIAPSTVTLTFPLTHIREIHPRRFLLRDTALEVYCFLDKKSYYFNLLTDEAGVGSAKNKSADEIHRSSSSNSVAETKAPLGDGLTDNKSSSQQVDEVVNTIKKVAPESMDLIETDSDEEQGDFEATPLTLSLGDLQVSPAKPLVSDSSPFKVLEAEVKNSALAHDSKSAVVEAEDAGITRRVKIVSHVTRQRDGLIKMLYNLASLEEQRRVTKTILPIPSSAMREQAQLLMTQRWCDGTVSNYDYLLFLNYAAGRSKNDLSQYPVFPWVICDYSSPQLDLQDPKVYRDLSLPVGALNKERWEDHYGERFRTFEDPEIPPFHYGSHYSTPANALWYLMRKRGYAELAREFQGGAFDLADRLFDGIPAAYDLCLNNIGDVKECIPDFYEEDTSFLQNLMNLEFGVKQDGEPVDDARLPPWARDARDFLRLNRRALESPYVSAHLHLWIDLIFGYKQRGKEAEKAKNVFFHLTYAENVNIDQIADDALREATQLQVVNFGQAPKQLLTEPHPRRKASVSATLNFAAQDLAVKAKDGLKDKLGLVKSRWATAAEKIKRSSFTRNGSFTFGSSPADS